jgi:CxxC motif-containing protein (DUF1111 family)
MRTHTNKTLHRTLRRALPFASAALVAAIFLLAFQLRTDLAGGRAQVRATPGVFIRGDSNDDGRVDVSDPVFALGFHFLGGDIPACLAAADSNDDGAIDVSDAAYALTFLFLGGEPPPPPFPAPGPDPTPDLGCGGPPLAPLPAVGSAGGPDRELSDEEALSFRRGLELFDGRTAIVRGLGPVFNGDSCRACHLDPVVGGAGPIDVDVVRFARNDGGVVSQLEGGPAASRHSILDLAREEFPAAANVVETRQTPTLLGLGLVDRIPAEVILANADTGDQDGDGISGRPRMVGDRIGRFGHKSGVPSLVDFAADALLNELGVTVDPIHSTFAGVADTDGVADPELPDQEFLDLAFFISHLAPPARRVPESPFERERIASGEQLFADAGCVRCHLPELAGADGPVRAYSDFLLHEVADPARVNVNEPGVEPREFRTAPLWGLRDTGPYLHDGSAESVRAAIEQGHHGEAAAARAAFRALTFDEQARIEEFLLSL